MAKLVCRAHVALLVRGQPGEKDGVDVITVWAIATTTNGNLLDHAVMRVRVCAVIALGVELDIVVGGTGLQEGQGLIEKLVSDRLVHAHGRVELGSVGAGVGCHQIS